MNHKEKDLLNSVQHSEKRVIRQFTADYRKQVIALIKQEMRSVTSVSRELGLSSRLIYGRIQKSKASTSPKKSKDSSPLLSQKTVLPADDVAVLAKLSKENDEHKE